MSKTPDEIKKGLTHCSEDGCKGCNYEDDCNMADGFSVLAFDALAYIKQLEEACQNFVNVIHELAEQVPKWIDVEERLPEDDEFVLVFGVGKYGSVVAMTSYTHHMYGYDIEGWRSPWDYFHNNYTVTHWMPLPEPPKEVVNG